MAADQRKGLDGPVSNFLESPLHRATSVPPRRVNSTFSIAWSGKRFASRAMASRKDLTELGRVRSITCRSTPPGCNGESVDGLSSRLAPCIGPSRSFHPAGMATDAGGLVLGIVSRRSAAALGL